MRTIITTAGTSLLTNRGDDESARPWAGWRRGQPLPTQGAALTWLRRADPVRAAAETHTLERLSLRETDRIVWLASDTPEGRWCAETLCAHYAAARHSGMVKVISGLGYHEGLLAERGLHGLLDTVFAAIQDAGGPDRVILCATGGFKVELAYINLVGLLLGIDVYYVHEQFADLIVLPRLPIHWDTGWVAQREAFFHWIDEEPRPTAQVENRLKADPELRPLVADDADGNTYLTPAGNLLYRAYRVTSESRTTWPPASSRAPGEKNMVSGVAHHRPQGWQQWVERLASMPEVESVRVEPSGQGRGGGRPQIYRSDPATGTIGILFGRGGIDLPLLVKTTARDEAQLDLVRGWIERNMGKW